MWRFDPDPGIRRCGDRVSPGELLPALPLLLGSRIYPFLLGLTVVIYVYSHLAIDHANTLGFFVVNFVFFTAASVGAMLVSATAYGVRMERFQPVGRVAELTAATCLVEALLFMVLDLGRPARLASLVRGPHFASWLVWDVTIIGIYLGNMVALGYVMARRDVFRALGGMPAGQRRRSVLAVRRVALATSLAAREGPVLRRLAVVFLPVAILLHAAAARLLTHLAVEPGWVDLLVSPIFIVSTPVFGLALVILAATVSRAFPDTGAREAAVRDLGRILFFLIAPHGYCLLAETEIPMLTHRADAFHVFRETTVGPYAPLFWFVFVGGVIVPFLLLWCPRTRMVSGIGVAALLVVLGVLAEQWNVIVPALLGHAHLPYTAGGYVMTQVELSVTVAVYGIGAFVYFGLGPRLLQQPGASRWDADDR